MCTNLKPYGKQQQLQGFQYFLQIEKETLKSNIIVAYYLTVHCKSKNTQYDDCVLDNFLILFARVAASHHSELATFFSYSIDLIYVFLLTFNRESRNVVTFKTFFATQSTMFGRRFFWFLLNFMLQVIKRLLLASNWLFLRGCKGQVKNPAFRMGNHVTLTFYDTMIVNKKVSSKNMKNFKRD